MLQFYSCRPGMASVVIIDKVATKGNALYSYSVRSPEDQASTNGFSSRGTTSLTNRARDLTILINFSTHSSRLAPLGSQQI